MIANVPLPFFKSESTPRTPLYEDDGDDNEQVIEIGVTDEGADKEAQQELREKKLSRAHAGPM